MAYILNAMKKQNQIKMRIRNNIACIQNLLKKHPDVSRTDLARKVCSKFNLYDTRGNLQLSGCLKALRDLEGPATYTLPVSSSSGTRIKQFRRLKSAVPEPENVPDFVNQIQTLILTLVDSEAEMRIWNELMIREHPQGSRPLVGRQIRYLVSSEHGYLGALGFASASLSLGCRDQWIGWPAEARNEHLDKIVCMNRFLIRNSVHCKNLASRVLGMVAKVLPDDFENKYGYSPWLLESFINPENYQGTCYQAANWQKIGQSTGRGRQDRKHLHAETAKDVYVYVLDKKFRSYLGIKEVEKYKAIDIFEGLDNTNWASREFGAAPLGDRRLNQRLISIATQRGNMPNTSYLEAVKGNEALTKGYYRFIEKPDESAVSMENILKPHQERTLARIKNEQEVLCVHDTTDLNFNTLEECECLGIIGNNSRSTNKSSKGSKGLRLHSSLVLTEDGGLPLGVLNAECFAPEINKKHKRKNTKYVPIEEKDSFRWIKALESCMSQRKKIPDCRLIHVMDREADFFELFDFWRDNKKNNELIIRAQYNRRITTGVNLFDSVKNSELKGTCNVAVQRKSSRKKQGKKEATPARKARIATLEIRYHKISLSPPGDGLNKDKKPVELIILHAFERKLPADGSKPIEWFILTTIDVDSADKAAHILGLYAKRWRIEDWHKVLKSGCRIEELLYDSAERLKRMAAVNMVIAWRIMLMTLIGREQPELPVETLFSDTEIKVLKLIAKQENLPPPENAGKGVFIVAKMGGYLGRKSDYPPGHIVLWRGLITLLKMCDGYILFHTE